VASPLDDVVYTLLVTDANGCFGSGDLLIEVDPSRNVYIPNAFTPNNDGINDIFGPFTGTGVRRIQNMQIFDRWGELVFFEDDFLPDPLGTTGWDGRFGGSVMNPAVFVYIISVEFTDDQVLTYKGNVTLLR
jgi:gliding motility-associated-like protein